MLTADLVGARRRGDELRLIPVDAGRRTRIETLAAAFSAIARTHVGATRAVTCVARNRTACASASSNPAASTEGGRAANPRRRCRAGRSP